MISKACRTPSLGACLLYTSLDQEGKTRYWLVKQMGTDYATVNKICDNASKSVRIDTLERLMKALDCEVQDLFTEE